MFLIDKHGERPVCGECRRPFPATPEQVEELRKSHPRTAIVCPACIVRECGKPVTRRREAAIAI